MQEEAVSVARYAAVCTLMIALLVSMRIQNGPGTLGTSPLYRAIVIVSIVHYSSINCNKAVAYVN